MGWATRAPDVIGALVQAFETAPELEGVLVMDGPAIASSAATRVLSVGWADESGEPAVESQVLPEGLAGNPDHEVFVVRCAISVLSGDTDVATVRGAAYELLNAAGTIVACNRQLGGAMRVQMGAHSMTPAQTRQGALTMIMFEVEVDAFTRR